MDELIDRCAHARNDERASIVAYMERELAEMPDVGGAGYAQHWGGELRRRIAMGEHIRFEMERSQRELRHG